MADILNRSEVQKFLDIVTNPQNGEEYSIALNFWVTHISKENRKENEFAALVYDLIKEKDIQLLKRFVEEITSLTPEQRAELRDFAQRLLLDSRKELAAVMGHHHELEDAHYFDESNPLEIQISELQEKITEHETRIADLKQRVEEHEHHIEQRVAEWQEVQDERRDAFVEDLQEVFSNRFQMDEKGNAIVDENGEPVHAVMYDADGKEVTMDPEADKQRCDAVKAAIDKTPPPDKVYDLTDGHVTAEQCSKTNSLSRAINVVMALQAIDPKSKDASSLNYDKHASVGEVQSKIDRVRERGDAVERKREAYAKLNKAEVRLKEMEEQISNAPDGPEKTAMLAARDGMKEDVAVAQKELDVILKADAHNQKKIKSNFLAAINRVNGKDPDHPGLRSTPVPTFERFDQDKDQEPEYEKKDTQKISDILDNCRANSAAKAELEDTRHELRGMERDLKLLQDQKLQQEHGHGRGAGA